MKATNKPEVRVLKTATCPSLSGKSKLTYQIGGEENAEGVCTPKSEIQICIYANTGSGFYNNDFVAYAAIQQILDKTKLITSFSLHPLYRGKSVNTAGFLLAALKQEGLVRPAKEEKRSYERGDPKAFLTAAKALLDSPAALKAKAKPVAAKDAPMGDTKKPAVTPKKTPSKSSVKKKA